MSGPFEGWGNFTEILCVRPDNLGDVLMTTPAIRALKQAVPGRRITLLTSRAGASVARHVPEIDAIEVFDPPWYRHDQVQGRMALATIAERLAKARFDAAVIFTVFSQNPLPNAMLCYMAGIPRVAGYCRENPYALISDWLPDEEPLRGARHEVERQLDLAEALGASPTETGLSLETPGDQREKVLALLEKNGIDVARPWVLMHPGASESRRRYPAENFASAAAALRDELGVQVVVTGSEAERDLAEAVANRAGKQVACVAGELAMPAFIALVSMAALLVSNNTGPVHIAAAVGTPVVVLYALTNPQHAPWQVNHRVLPFDVPRTELSRNVMVRYAAERFFPEPVGMPHAVEIVSAASALLEDESCSTASGLVTAPPAPAVYGNIAARY